VDSFNAHFLALTAADSWQILWEFANNI